MTRRCFADSRLGGAGKTQTAIQYALLHSSRYEHGVFLINASSVASIHAAADRFLNMLKAPNRKALGGDDRLSELEKWLQSRDRWLLILDGANDLQTLNPAAIFPQLRTGHIIVTTQDQAAHTFISKHGNRIGEMEGSAAVQALLDKAMVKNPNAAQMTTAMNIVDLLGYLPIAIDQAGAYMTARQKSLSEYENLFREHSHELFRTKLRSAPREQTMQAAWELNFNHLQKTSPDATILLSLLAFLEPNEILIDTLRRGCSVKNVWDWQGEATRISPNDTGINPRLVDICNNELRLDAAVDDLCAFSLVWRVRTMEGHSALALHPLVQWYTAGRTTQGDALHWKEQAVLCICQAFPYSENLEPERGFGERGRQMLAQVPKILSVFDKIKSEIENKSTVRSAVLTMLLSASKFGNRYDKQDMIQRAKTLLRDGDDAYLATWTAARESALMRIFGDNERSYGVLQEHIHKLSQFTQSSNVPLSPRTNALRGELVLSYAANLLTDAKGSRAAEELEAWQPLSSKKPSNMELDVAHRKHLMLGRVLRDEGRFNDAIAHYQELSQYTKDDNDPGKYSWQALLSIHLADLYCEIGSCSQALQVLHPELKLFSSRSWEQTPRGTDLALCRVEVFIRQGQFETAQEELSRLEALFVEVDKPDMLTKTKHFRVLVGLARISHLMEQWGEAETHWHRALKFLENNQWTNSFNEAMTLLSLAQALFRLGRKSQAEATYKKAQASLEHEGPKFWIVGLGTYWYSFVKVPLGESGPSPMLRNKSTHEEMSSLGTLVSQLKPY